MKQLLMASWKIDRFKKWCLLSVAIMISVLMPACQRNSISNTVSLDNKSDWTDYTDGNTVVQVLAKGNYLWAVTEGGIVRRDMNTGTYQKYTTSDGLINNNVSSVTQDNSGNLWFVTGGVTEYNGKTWQNLPHIVSTTPVGVGAIAFDSKNNLYIGMSDGSIYFFSGEYQQIKSPDEMPNNGSLGIHGALAMEGIKALAVDKNNTLWSFGAEGTQRYDRKSWVASQDISGFPQGTIDFIGKDKNNDLWFQDNTDFSSSYLYRYDGASWQKIDIQFTDSNAQSITIDNQGNLWCATIGTLKRYNGKTWQTFNCPVGSIDSIAADDKGNIWCGVYLNGVLCFDGNSWKTYSTNDIPGTNGPTFIATDNAGNTWFSTDYGLIRLKGNNWVMVNKDIVDATGFLQDKQGNLWFASGNNVYRYESESWDVFDIASEWFENITSLTEDNQGNIWASSYNNVYKYDGKTWTTIDVRNIFGVTQTNILVNSVTVDNQNTIWVGTTDGILHFDGTNWKVFTKADGLVDNYIAGFIQDKSGNIWAYGFNNGLSLYNGSSWQSFLQDDRIIDVTQDKNGNIWLATDHGVTKYDGNNFQSFTTTDGLLDNSINTVVVDRNNDVWCGTDYGANYYGGQVWRSITTSEGLAGGQILQIVNGKFGDTWFSSFGGVSHYIPN